MKHKVFINGRFLTQRVTGVQRYAGEVLRAFDQLLSENDAAGDLDVAVLAPPGAADPKLRAMQFRQVGRLRGNAWEQCELPRHSRGGLLFSLCATGPLFKREQLVTFHDASVFAVPQAFSFVFRTWYRALQYTFAHHHPMLLTVSRFSQQELSRYLSVDSSHFRITTEGYEHLHRVSADTKVLSQHGLIPQKFVLAVSSLTANKNFELLIRAMMLLEQPDFTIAIAGGKSEAVFGDVRLPELPFVKQLGFVTDGELRALYENAALFVFPSFYEGFGIPALEAMASGCPVVASNSASVPEVCAEAAEYIAPSDAQGLADKMAHLMAHPDEREQLAQRGRKRVQDYTWDESARLNLKYLRERLGLPPPSTWSP